MSDHDHLDDDDFDDFLHGRGELARQLSTLPQPAPAASLDAAILAQVAGDLTRARESGAPTSGHTVQAAAANDALIVPTSASASASASALASPASQISPELKTANSAPTLRAAASRGYLQRWRLPLAIAASVIGSATLLLEWQRQAAPVPVLVPASAPTAAVVAATAPIDKTVASAPQPPPPPPMIAAASARTAAQTPAPTATAATIATTATAVAPAHHDGENRDPIKFAAPASQRIAAAPIAAPETLAADATQTPAPEASYSQRISITGSRVTAADVAQRQAATAQQGDAVTAPAAATISAAATSSTSAGSMSPPIYARSAPTPAPSAPAADNVKAQAWLAMIDQLLQAGLRDDALHEWGKFRLAYPRYPVPKPFRDRIKALQP